MTFSGAPKGKVPYISDDGTVLGDSYFIRRLDENFEKGPRQFFNVAPAPIRPILRVVIRGKVRKMLKGLGRHTAAERLELGRGDVNSVAALLGYNTYLLGDKISGADASVFGSHYSVSSSYFNTELGAYIMSQPKIMAYLERMRTRFFPESLDGKA